jgi:transporter family-2 protein
MTAALILLALCLGAAATLQGHANGTLSGRVGLFPTIWLNALIVFGASTLAWLLSGRGRPVDPAAPWWMHLGGAYGLAIIAGAAFLFPRLGAGPTMALLVAAQLATALALDHSGATGVQLPLTPARIAGALLLVAGAILVLWPRFQARG